MLPPAKSSSKDTRSNSRYMLNIDPLPVAQMLKFTFELYTVSPESHPPLSSILNVLFSPFLSKTKNEDWQLCKVKRSSVNEWMKKITPNTKTNKQRKSRGKRILKGWDSSNGCTPEGSTLPRKKQEVMVTAQTAVTPSSSQATWAVPCSQLLSVPAPLGQWISHDTTFSLPSACLSLCYGIS